MNFYTELREASQADSKFENHLLFPYYSVIKLLLLITSRYPLLLPTIYTFNCASTIPVKDDLLFEKIPVLKNFSGKQHLSFLGFYLRIINYVTLDKLRYFLVESSACRDVLSLEKSGDDSKPVTSIGEEIGQEIIRELETILAEEVEKPDFLESGDSIQTICASSSLLIAFLPVRHLLRIILRTEKG